MTKAAQLELPRTRRRFLLPQVLAAGLTLSFAGVLLRWIEPEPHATPSQADRVRWDIEIARQPPPTPPRTKAEPQERRALPQHLAQPNLGALPATVAPSPVSVAQVVTAPDELLATAVHAATGSFTPELPETPELLPLRATASALQPPVHLLPITATPPLYPMEALRRGLSGWVLLAYRVTKEGRVTDIRVLDAEPPSVFNAEAAAAARKWRYEPVLVDGQPVELPQVWSKLTFTMPTTEEQLKAEAD